MPSRRPRVWLLALSLLGLVASGMSAYVHYRLLQDASYTSFCDISAAVNCETVYRSRYGSLGGVPVAIGGVIWFALSLLLSLRSERVEAAPEPARRGRGRQARAEPQESTTSGYLFALSTVALAAVMYLGYASFFILETVCILCVLTYVAVVGLFIVSGASAPARLSALPRLAARDLARMVRRPVALVLALLYVAGAAAAIVLFPRDEGITASAGGAVGAELRPDQRSEFEGWIESQPRATLPVDAGGARVVVVKFNDYQCPPCRQTYVQYKPILAQFNVSHPGQVKFVTMDFPLEAECNTGGSHAAACEAAAAVRMARPIGQADALEEWLFENQPAMSAALVRQGVSQVAGIKDFEARYPRMLEQVKADVALGRQLGVSRTPTFFVNGIKIEGGLLPQYFEAAIAYELERTPGRAETR